MDILRENIVYLRKKHHLTQRMLSDQLNLANQTISKWENGQSLPDITLLPKLAEIFSVSVDQLLGLVAIDESSYIKRNKDKADYRNKNINQFEASRALYWNEDYLKFLIKEVWKITQPVKLAEVACGTGSFEQVIMKYLPLGSSYTGFEVSELMRSNNPRILPMDKTRDYNDFDMVICQGHLRQSKNPIAEINKMKDLVKKGGLIICHEENRPFENAGLLIGDDDSFEKGNYLEKIWKKELENEGRDYRVGLRAPVLMKTSGLNNIESRLNDRINLVLQSNEDLMQTINEHFRLTSITEDDFNKFLLSRGLDQFEAQRYIELYHKRKNYMTQDIEDITLVHTIGLVVTWATK